MPPATVLPLTLAQLPDPKSSEAVGWIVVTIGGILVTIHYALQIWRALHPIKVPADSDVYATKAEMLKLERDHFAEMQRIEKRFEEWLEARGQQHKESMTMWQGWRDDFQKWQLTIERALGHVEVKADRALEEKPTSKKG